MKDILVLLLLIVFLFLQVCSQPYKADSDGKCHNTTTEYQNVSSKLCCKKCPPGKRMIKECSETNDTHCEQCPPKLYMESWNYAKNCRSCPRCKQNKGLQYAQNCSSTTSSKCVCLPGMYCLMGFDDPYCSDCKTYTQCKPGYGVSQPGTANSDAKCLPCPNGTFSNTTSSTDRCRPHTNCNGRIVLKEGDNISDTECEPFKEKPHTLTVLTTAITWTSTVVTLMTSHEARSTTQSVELPVPDETSSSIATSPPPTLKPIGALGVIIAAVCVPGFLSLFIILVLMCFYKCRKQKDSTRLHLKVDANGNCESGDKISQSYLGDSQMTSFKADSQEQQYLLEKGEASSDHSQCTDNTTETLTRTDGFSSNDSIGPLQSTSVADNLPSALSEPRTLLSNTEPIAPQPSVQTQSSSQPTSPQIISPMTTSPHVNVNITLHIGNGPCGAPSFIPTDSMQADCKLPFGEEEECFSTPQQEAGKESLMSVQESATCSE
ncbi:tumor necrosis factor receptor superfamily member 1B [Pholidichthys leucotaenia]